MELFGDQLAVAGKALVRIELCGAIVGEKDRRNELLDGELFRELLLRGRPHAYVHGRMLAVSEPQSN